MTEIINISNLVFSYHDGHVALADINLSVHAGEHVAIIGPNGAGKSTLMLHLNGILRGNGTVTIDGMVLSDKTIKELRKIVGIIFQDPNDQLFCPTVYDDISFGPMHMGMPKDEIESIVNAALSNVFMSDAKYKSSHHLSLGEKRRITIATVLACDPKIIAMDEPAASLDPKRRNWLIDFINKSSHTIILATHDMDLAQKTCGRTILMNQGKIMADGPTQEIINDRELLSANDLV